MYSVGPYTFKYAETAEELDQVHRLNYRTFVREVPQHRDPGTGTGLLIDKFHEKNTYMIGVREGRLVGMLAAHDRAPFSVAARLPDPAVLTGPGVRPLEVRLLAVEPGERHSAVIVGLFWCLHCHALENGHSHFVVSGLTGQKDLYRHLGFHPLGPPVGEGGAAFVPMWATTGRIEEAMGRTLRLWAKRAAQPYPDRSHPQSVSEPRGVGNPEVGA